MFSNGRWTSFSLLWKEKYNLKKDNKPKPFSEILAFDFHTSKINNDYEQIHSLNRFWTQELIIISKPKIYTFIFQEEEKKEADDKEAEVKPTEEAPAVPVEAPPAAPVEAPPAPVEAPPAPVEEPAAPAPAPVVEEAALPAPPPVVEATEEKTIEKTDVETKEPDTEAPAAAAAPEVAAAAPETTGEE